MLRLPEKERDQVRRIDAQRIVGRIEGRRRAEVTIENGDPAVERRKIRPFEVVTVDGMRGGHQHPAQIAALLEAVVGDAQQLFGAMRLRVVYRDALLLRESR